MLAMGFDVTRDAYDRYMGRYSDQLAHAFAAFAAPGPGARVLDVGCGPGALTEVLATNVGGAGVAAADPSSPFVEACAARVPAADVRQASADDLPWADGAFDVVVAQLVLNFLPDADAGLAEMARVVRPGGRIAACTWAYASGMQMLNRFWEAVRDVDPAARDESSAMRYITQDELEALWQRSGLTDVQGEVLPVSADYADFDDYWSPVLLGVGPGGAYVSRLDPAHVAELRDACFRRLGSPSGPFSLTAEAVAVAGRRAS
jgi:SAM-dependent methyltransferase